MEKIDFHKIIENYRVLLKVESSGFPQEKKKLDTSFKELISVKDKLEKFIDRMTKEVLPEEICGIDMQKIYKNIETFFNDFMRLMAEQNN